MISSTVTVNLSMSAYVAVALYDHLGTTIVSAEESDDYARASHVIDVWNTLDSDLRGAGIVVD